MLDAAVTIATAFFLAHFWSKWRYGFVDALCVAAALACAFVLPVLAERFAPELADLGVLAFDAGGALLGCLIYDTLSYR
jgi:hypothetical protein